MKNRKIAALLSAAVMLGTQCMPALAQSEEPAAGTYSQESIKNGDSFRFTVNVPYTDEKGNYSELYYETLIGTVGSTWSFEIPKLQGYVFKGIDSQTEAPGIQVNGSKISFNASPSMMGWQPDSYITEYYETNIYYDGTCIYLSYERDPEFKLVPGWNQLAYANKEDNLAWYWCDNNLNFVTGLQTLKNGAGEDTLYYFYSDGHMAQSEFVNPDASDYSKQYFFGSSGALKKGWICRKYYNSFGEQLEDWYYSNPQTGYIKTGGWLKDKGQYYYLYDAGYMATSTWIEENGKRYYVTNSGGMATSRWIHYEGKDYYVNEKGEMVTNQWVGPYWVGEDGAWDANKTK